MQREKPPFPYKPTGFILTSEANNPDSLKCEILLGPPMVRKRRQAYKPAVILLVKTKLKQIRFMHLNP